MRKVIEMEAQMRSNYSQHPLEPDKKARRKINA